MRGLVNEKSSKYPEMKSHNFLAEARCKWNCSTFTNLMKGQVVCDTTVLSNSILHLSRLLINSLFAQIETEL